jgi:hypothetical protein
MLALMNEITLVHLISKKTSPGLAEAFARVNFTDYVEIQVDSDPARTCQRIANSVSTKSLIIMGTGDVCNQLPAIALAQRASGKQILSYQLLQPTLPAFTDSWPQAPISAYFPAGSSIPKEATLRGIQIEEFADFDELARFIGNYLL